MADKQEHSHTAAHSRSFFQQILSALKTVYPAIIFLLLLYFISFYVIMPALQRGLIRGEYKLIEHRTALFYNEIDKAYQNVVAGKMTQDQAQKSVKDYLRSFRYGPNDSNYIWICDKHHKLVMHPFLTNMENHPVDDLFHFPKDAAIFHQALNQAITQRSGLIEYQWYQPDTPTLMQTKNSYTMYFKPWGWIVGTGFILDDVRADIAQVRSKILILLILVFVMSVIWSAFLVTRTNLANRRRQYAEAKLIEGERYYRHIFNAVNECIFIHDAQTGAIIDVNNRFEDFFGYSKKEAQNFGPNQLSLGKSPYSDKEAYDFIQKAFTEGPQHFEWLARHRNGRLFWLDISLVNSHIAGHNRVIAIARDINERKKNEKDRDSFYNELKNTNLQLEQYFYAVSHDLKAPIVTISGFAHLLKGDLAAGNTDNAESMIDNIISATTKMSQLLNGLTEFSHSRHSSYDQEPVNMNEVVNDAIELSAGIRRDDKLQIIIDNELPNVKGHRIALIQVMQNLITNAIKYMGQSAKPEIHIGFGRHNGQEAFYVRDYGIGIPYEKQTLIFRPFEQINPQSEGSGLGLSLVKRIIEQQNGKIWVESTSEHSGSTFWFTLETC